MCVKRTLTNTTAVKANKKLKIQEEPDPPAGEEVDGLPEPKDMKPVGRGFLKKIDKLIQELQEGAIGLRGDICKAATPEVKECVPLFVLEKSERLVTTADTAIEKLTEIQKLGRWSKGDLTTTLSQAVETNDNLWKAWDKMEQAVIDAYDHLGINVVETEEQSDTADGDNAARGGA
eukprot:4989435-Karenia_brevis.AAC.1